MIIEKLKLRYFLLSKHPICVLLMCSYLLIFHHPSLSIDADQINELNIRGLFRLIEEQPNGTEVIGVDKYLRKQLLVYNSSLILNFDKLQFHFQLLNNHDSSRFSDAFELELLNGRLIQRKRIDRESICASNFRTINDDQRWIKDPNYSLKESFLYDKKCLKKLSILSTVYNPQLREKNVLKKIVIKILIIDINDNKPFWNFKTRDSNSIYPYYHLSNTLISSSTSSIYQKQIPLIEIKLLENAKDARPNYKTQNTKSNLPRAFDPDEGPNGRISYHLRPINKSSDYLSKKNLIINHQAKLNNKDRLIPFELIDNLNGPLELKTMIFLDYEQIKLFEFYLLAIDMGTPQRTGTASIKVSILDVNDESPKFEKKLFSQVISEKTIPGTVVMNLSATDADSSITNNQIRFELVPGTIASNYFLVHPDGLVSLKHWIDYETIDLTTGIVESDKTKRKQFVFNVKAIDSAPVPYEKTSTALVVIPIIDENDELPIISVQFLGTEQSTNYDEVGKLDILFNLLQKLVNF